MKKKMLTGLGMAAVCAAMFLNGSINMDKGTTDAALADLVNAPTANAECGVSDPWYPLRNGKCLMAGFCVAAVGYTECDSFQP